MLEAHIITATSNVIQLVRQDEMFESGKGIMVLWPEGGLTCVNCREDNGDRDGLQYLLKEVKEFCPNCQEYKITSAYYKLKMANNYSRVNVRVK